MPSFGSISEFAISEILATVATAYTLTGPTSGSVGVPSSNFTVTPNGPLSGGDSVTMSDGGAGGTFTPVSPLSFAASSSTGQTFTYTPASAGAVTITVVSATLGLPVTGSPITFTATAGGKVPWPFFALRAA